MKRLIKRFSFLAIALATALLIIGLSIPINSNKPAVAFEYFPFNEPQTINFQAKAYSLNKFTERQKKDQFLDWLLFTVESDPSFSTKEISEASYDISPVRFDYLKPVSNFEYGDTRSLYVGKETIVALIPQDSSPEQRIDYLAHIADKHRQNLGRIPEKLEVFEYQLDLETDTAQLTRIEELETNSLFDDKKYGYHQTYIKKLSDLNQFMAKVDDITFAQVIDSDLLLGGRKIKSHSYGKISVEDVAALWQSENKIEKQFKQLITDIQSKYLLNSQGLSQAEFEKKVIQDFQEELQKRQLVDGSGFSLDPAYDYQGLSESLTKISSQLLAFKSNGKSIFTNQEIEKVQKSLSQNNVFPYLHLIDNLKLKLNDISFSIFENPSLESLKEIYDFLQTPRTRSFQRARYDGDLEGTEVGMVLYYTDLLAKLWALDYLGTTPERYIADFQPLTQISAKVSSIYEQELRELPDTRVWFGHQDKGFQIADNNRILFARNATRIFAASSNSLEPGKETIATTNSEAFLGWWNEHYEEVACYEPQYERLNEIMKWSLIISWLNESKRGEVLGFLQDVPVSDDKWFPDWVQANIKQLKFKQWDTKTCLEDFNSTSKQPKVCFYPRGYKGTTTEAMPLLSSESFTQFGESGFIISGGVSLSNPQTIANRDPLPKNSKISSLSLRGNIDYKSVKVNNKILSFNTLDGATYNLQIDSKIASVIAKAKNGTKFRDLDSEFINVKELVRQISRTDDGITINAVAGDTNIGSFSSSKTGNAFTVGWHSLDIDEGHSLARELSYYSRYDDFETILIDHPKVNSVAKSKDAPVYYVKTNNSEKWLKLASGGDGGEIPPDYTFRVASTEPPEIPDPWFIDPSDDSESLLLGWVDDLDDPEIQVIFSRSKHKKSSISEDIRNGDYIAAAPKFIRQKRLNKALTEINSLMKSEDYKGAAKLVDDSIDELGQEPDLMIRKAAVNIKLRGLKVKAVSIEGLEPPNSADVFDELNGIVENKNKGKFKAIEKDDAFIYVQDSPELNNIDWSNPIENSISYMSAKTRVYKLQDGDIGNIKLEDFGFDVIPPINNENLQLSPANPNSSSNNQFYRGNFSRGLRGTVSDNKCQDIKEDQIKQVECNSQENNVYVMYVPD